MIRKLKFHQVDWKKYSECIENSVQKNIFASYEFMKAVNGENWDILIWGDYDVVMPVPFVRKFGVKFVIRPWSTQQLGIFSKTDIPTVNQKFLNFLHKNFNIRYYAFNEKNQFLNVENNLVNFTLCQEPYEKIRSRYSVHRRRNVRILNGFKDQFSFGESADFNKFKYFFLRNQKGVPRTKLKFFWTKLENLFTNGLLKIYYITLSDEYCSVAFILKKDNQEYMAVFLNDKKFSSYNFSSIMIDQILQRNIEYSNFSMMGSKIPAVADFYRRFGAEEVRYYTIIASFTNVIKNRFKNR